jgi:hypothetical protein
MDFIIVFLKEISRSMQYTMTFECFVLSGTLFTCLAAFVVYILYKGLKQVINCSQAPIALSLTFAVIVYSSASSILLFATKYNYLIVE